MKFRSSKENLIETINIVQKAVSAKSTLPILEGILIEAEENLKMTGNDLEIGIESYIDAEIIEKGSLVINSKIFGDIIRRLPDSEVTIESNEKNIVTIECENSHFEIKGMSSEGFPTIPEIKAENSFSISQKVLRDMIRQTIFAIGTDEYRPVLMGSLMEYKNNELNLISIDGNRIALRTHPVEKEINELSIVIPGKTLNEIVKILPPEDDEIKICNSQNQIMFDTGKFKVVSRLIEGEFLNYRYIMPEDYETKVTISTKDLLSSIERAYLIIMEEKEKRYPIRINVANDKMIIMSNTETGSVREELSIEMSGKKIEIGFNPRYFIEALKAIDDEAVVIYFTSNLGPCTIKPIEGNSFAHMILPIRL